MIISRLTVPEDDKINFKDNFDPVLLLELRHNYQRKATQEFFNIVRLQDIKNIVTFSVTVECPVYFIHLFHSTRINPFLRSLIVYFQQYLLVSVYTSLYKKISCNTIYIISLNKCLGASEIHT